MNKRGFTLVEILATIVIIALVTIIGTVSVNGIRKRIEQKIFTSWYSSYDVCTAVSDSAARSMNAAPISPI